jgi:hypothetical protein
MRPENFRDSCAGSRIAFTNASASRARVEMERTLGFTPLTSRLDQNPIARAGRRIPDALDFDRLADDLSHKDRACTDGPP